MESHLLIGGGDNTGIGIESIYIHRARFLQAFPGATSFTLDLRCFWNANYWK